MSRYRGPALQILEARQTLSVWGLRDSPIGDDRGHERMWRHIECRIEYADTVRNHADATDVGDFGRVALFDRNMRAIRNRQVQRRERRRDIKWNLVLLRQNGNWIRSDFVRDVAICGNAVRAHDHGIDQTLVHDADGHVVRYDANVDAVFPDFPGGHPGPLKN